MKTRFAGPADPAAYSLGLLAAFPISYPEVPYYVVAFFILLASGAILSLSVTRPLNRTAIGLAAAAPLLAAIAITSSLLSPFQEFLGPARIVTTSLFYLFFICGLAICNHERFFRGFVDGMAFQALLVCVASMFYLPWSAGALVLSVPEFRLWGAEIFPDWPNFYAAMFSIAFIVALAVQERRAVAFLCLAAALLTTSRTVFIAVVIVAVWYLLLSQKRFLALRWIVFLGGSIALIGLGIGLLSGAFSSELTARLFLISDRLTILWSSLDLALDNPWLGVGGVLLDESVGHFGAPSFHNSYLEVAVRMGLIGLLVYLPLVFSPLWLLRWFDPLLPVAVFILVGSMFQNLLRHPHIAIVFSVLIAWAGVRAAAAADKSALALPQLKPT